MKFSIIADQLCSLSKVNIGAFYKKMISEGHELIIDYMEADIIIFQPCRLVKINKKLIDKIKNKKIKALFCYKKEDFNSVKEIDFISNKWIEKENNKPVFRRKDTYFSYIGSGCIRRCAYCPIKRKNLASRPIKSILKDIQGAKRVVLCADDCSSYGYGLIKLLEKIPQKDIVLSYVYPAYLIENADYFIENKERISIDIMPMQSASQRILKLMNRGDYDAKKILDIINQLRIYNMHFIFGYPTETWDDFIETVNFEKNVKTVEGKTLWFAYGAYEGTESEKIYGKKKNPLILSMEEYLLKEEKYNRIILNFSDENYGSIVIGFTEEGEMLFYNAKSLERVKGVWNENDVYHPPGELLGRKKIDISSGNKKYKTKK
jgi:radical SAM superfamily enzyme YgiQ (UPF0313 family)